MKIYVFILVVIFASCGQGQPSPKPSPAATSLSGTWKLLTGTIIEKGDTLVTDYTRNTSFIKIINDSHFAFLQHDLKGGKDSGVFVAGGGHYTLRDHLYTEHLEYCSAREWEGNVFRFTISLNQDTLIQRGTEKVEKTGTDRINIEKYVRLDK